MTHFSRHLFVRPLFSSLAQIREPFQVTGFISRWGSCEQKLIPLFVNCIHGGSKRPTLDDVERLSYGKPSKNKIGSRRVPHRLNAEERTLFELARKKGFLSVKNNSRKYPLINTFRNLCDAIGSPNVRVELSPTGDQDCVIVDISTLRLDSENAKKLASELSSVAAVFQLDFMASIPEKEDTEEKEFSLSGLGEDNGQEQSCSDSPSIFSARCDRQVGKKFAQAALDCCGPFRNM